ncbi:TonB-dependent receptor [Telluribacter sp.]|uniref:TonB-dependent receptor n=1 Tax=Telluribacter sp. TaxID=1978767 RepID=UPI002E1191D3|nr:TonB-dependent receptor [Telluribacter sp.]
MKKLLRFKLLFYHLMKISLIQCLLAVIFAGASLAREASAQELLQMRVNLKIQNQEVRQVLTAIERQTKVKFAYRPKLVPASQRITITSTNESLAEVLDKITRPLQLKYEVVGQQIILSPRPDSNSSSSINLLQRSVTVPADRRITGRVTDETNTGLPGVSIIVKGTSRGTTTNVNGDFDLNVPENNPVLVISFVGYLTQEIVVGDQSRVIVSLKADTKSLEEVVVVGYGTQKKGNVTAAVTSIKSKDIQNQITKNPLEAMAGQLAGVSVTQGTGRPGANPVVRIRGAGSISAGNAPLYVVDGMPLEDASAFTQISPNDIESIDVLKDAASAAIYGSRGGNGVVLITTKKGKAGQAKIDFNYYTGIQQVTKKIDMQNRDQHIRLIKDGVLLRWTEAGGDPTIPNGQRIRNGSKTNYNYPDFYDDITNVPDTDWQDQVFRDAPISNYQLSGQGGTDKVRFYLSGNYFTQDGIIKATDFKRYSARVNVEADLTTFFRVGTNLMPSYTKENIRNTDGHFTSGGGAVLQLALLMPPTIPPRYEDGLYGQALGNPEYQIYAGPIFSPLPILEDPNYIDNAETIRMIGTAYAELEPIKDLKIRTSFGANTRNYTENFYRPSTVSIGGSAASTPGQPNPVQSHIASNVSRFQSINYAWENTATYQKIFGSIHDFSFLAGYSVQKTTSEGITAVGQTGTFENDQTQYVTGAATIFGNGSKEQWSLLSYLGRVNYTLKDRYLFSASIRRDGSSRFATNNKWAVFPSASVGWRLSSEPFMQALGDFLNELKIRASYGVTGNFNIGNYRWQATLSKENYNFGLGTGALAAGYAPGNFANPDLTWETNKQTDIGIDAAILKSRIGFSIDYYHRITDGLLYSIPVPAISGFTSTFGNVGEVQNKGIELELNTVNTIGEFKWTTSLNVSHNRNKVLSLGLNNEPIREISENTITQITEVGQPMAQFYGYKTDGVFMNQTDLDANPAMKYNASARPGDIRFVDVNGDGTITPDDRTTLGSPYPDFIYGVTNRLSYKNFDLDIQLQGVQGGKVFFLNSRFIGGDRFNLNALAATADYWRSESEPGDGITPRLGAPQITAHHAYRFLQDASYLRIRNITLGYNIPKQITERAHLNSVRIYATAQNPITFSKYIGYNPEVSTNGESVTAPGIDYGVYPLARTFTLGINIGL